MCAQGVTEACGGGRVGEGRLSHPHLCGNRFVALWGAGQRMGRDKATWAREAW